ncbi:putative lipase [Feldmannia species virus]|uniref:Putative lipase n=1 Tax=Feldmannia species virus TaxID=39420 RepID=B5LWD6_9PHYC|nr:putative lipase [Feldmannia species virus]ACH46799.1 putative lipase [Feldmannia species virus]
MENYTHTWNHLKLFAQMCDCNDDKHTVTDNWIRMLEKQHESVFPFTLWPLTYRTSAVILSTSLSTPKVKSYDLKPEQCKVIVKFYKSNEVVMICFQHISEGSSMDCSCTEWCELHAGIVPEEHDSPCSHGQHSTDSSQPLVKCGHLTMFSQVKKRVMSEFAKFNSQENDRDVSVVICMGYDKGAVLATFMAAELASDFKLEAEFMGFEAPKVTVDCISFSIPELGNEVYWKDFDSIVDRKIHVKHRKERSSKRPKSCIFVGNNEFSKNGTFRVRGWKSGRVENVVTCKSLVQDIENIINPYD